MSTRAEGLRLVGVLAGGAGESAIAAGGQRRSVPDGDRAGCRRGSDGTDDHPTLH